MRRENLSENSTADNFVNSELILFYLERRSLYLI